MKDSLNNKHILVYGPEGSGKGTQAKLLSELLTLPLYTSGDLVRQEASLGRGETAKICKQALASGEYVPDEVMFKLWGNLLSSDQAKKGFILDGFTRTLKQAKFLVKQALSAGYRIDKVIYLRINDKEAFKRLLNRNRKLFEGSTLSHDTPERIVKRLKVYRSEERKIIKLFRSQKILLEIDGNQSIKEVFEKIKEGLKFN